MLSALLRCAQSALLLPALLSLPGYAYQTPTDTNIDTTRPSYVLANGSLLWDNCGGEGDIACMPGSFAYSHLPGFPPLPKCDLTLDPALENGVWYCRDKGRRSIVPNQAWTQFRAPISQQLVFQQADQLGRISADLPINWVPIIGTHNSYSNFQDGGDNILNVDHWLTITDQLQMGARHIRLDPMGKVGNYVNSTPILCHASDYNYPGLSYLLLPTNEQEFCNTGIKNLGGLSGVFSFQRPFYLAVRELRRWLDSHPTEVVILRINYVGNSVFSGDSDYKSYISAIIEHELGPRLLEKASNPFPTLRAIRAAGKRVVLLSNRLEAQSAYANKDTSPSNNSSSPQFPGCFDGEFGHTGLFRSRTWENIGEDRALTTAFAPIGEKGLIQTEDVQIATYCGYSLIGLDFFHALPYAPNIYLGIGRVNYTGPSPDPRPQGHVWSWETGTLLNSPSPAVLQKPTFPLFARPEFLTDYISYRWKPMPENTVLPFACAAAPANPNNPRNYEWRITSAKGPWSEGETECQKLDSRFHFWRPMSSIENQQLLLQFKTNPNQQLWLNHYSNKTVAQPSNIDFKFAYSGPVTTNPTIQTVVMTSGMGGGFDLTFVPSGGAPNFLDVPATTSSPLIDLKVNVANLSNTPTGDYTGVLRIQESLGDSTQLSLVNVTLHLSRPVGQLTSTPNSVTFTSSTQRQVTIQSTPIPASLIQPTGLPSWLSASLNQLTTPATLTLTADPSQISGSQSFQLRLQSSTPNIQELLLPVSIAVSQFDLNSDPTGIPITVDGAQQASPFSAQWVVGSTHFIAAPSSYESNATRYEFQRWSDSNSPASRFVTAGAAPLSLTANYNSSYRLDLVQPANGGTISIQSGAASGSYHPAGSTVSLVANPAPGFVFQRFTGDLQSTQTPANLVMNGPKSVGGIFVPSQGRTTIGSVPSGLTITVDGANYTTPASFVWPAGETHTVSAPMQSGTPGVRYVFRTWSDSLATATRTIGGSSTDVSFLAIFDTEYQVATQVSPLQSGSLTGGGWFAPGATATLTATPATGFQFASFTGATSSGNTGQLVVNQPATVTANFVATTPPILYASSAARTDLDNYMVRVPIVLANAGRGPAGDAVITAIDSIQVPQGAGLATVQVPPAGLAVGTIFPGQRSQTTVDFYWPPSATRVTFTVRYSANKGAYSGANTITLFR